MVLLRRSGDEKLLELHRYFKPLIDSTVGELNLVCLHITNKILTGILCLTSISMKNSIFCLMPQGQELSSPPT